MAVTGFFTQSVSSFYSSKHQSPSSHSGITQGSGSTEIIHLHQKELEGCKKRLIPDSCTKLESPFLALKKENSDLKRGLEWAASKGIKYQPVKPAVTRKLRWSFNVGTPLASGTANIIICHPVFQLRGWGVLHFLCPKHWASLQKGAASPSLVTRPCSTMCILTSNTYCHAINFILSYPFSSSYSFVCAG